MYFNFNNASVATDAAFMQQIGAVGRELGVRGKGYPGRGEILSEK